MKEPAAHLELPDGPSAHVVAADAYRFDGYARYAASNFDEREKARVRAERFPRECGEAYAMAVALCREAEGASAKRVTRTRLPGWRECVRSASAITGQPPLLRSDTSAPP